MAQSTTPTTYNLAHPVYLDVPMMFSFLAALEGGVSVGGHETTSEAGTNERKLSARSGIRAKLFGVADAELGVEGGTQKRDEKSFVSQTERHHTAASLFNLLYGYLSEDKLIRVLSNRDEVTETAPGDIVEISGDYLGNPLEDTLGLASTFLPYLGSEEVSQPPLQHNPKSGNPAKRATPSAPAPAKEGLANETGVGMLKRMVQDIQQAPIHDLLFENSEGISCVATIDSQFLTSATIESLREGHFSVVGKVTRVLKEGDSINLARRTVLGVAGPEIARSIISGLSDSAGLSMRVPDPIVVGPALQILPMAIFV